jgi:hypothetical protein
MGSFATYLQHHYSFEPTQQTTHSSYGHSLEFSVKSRKHSTRTLSLIQNQVRFNKNLQTSTLAFNRGLNCTAATYIFTAPTCTTIIITSTLCIKCWEFQHFIPRFNKTSLLCRLVPISHHHHSTLVSSTPME